MQGRFVILFRRKIIFTRGKKFDVDCASASCLIRKIFVKKVNDMSSTRITSSVRNRGMVCGMPFISFKDFETRLLELSELKLYSM